MFKEQTLHRLNIIKSDPVLAICCFIALIKGFIFKYIYKYMDKNIIIGSSFRAYKWPYISGPGTVYIGNKVGMDMGFLRRPAIITHTEDSVVRIGDGSYLGGTRISCVGSVTIGAEALLGSATIIDSDIIPHKGILLDAQWKEEHVKPIQIDSHFWGGTNCFILSGSTIGRECVLGAGGVIRDKEVPDKSLMIGNPARKIGTTSST